MSTHTFNTQLPLWTFEFQSASKVQILTRKEIEMKLIAKSFKDEGFKIRLVENPRLVIEELFHIEVSKEIFIKVLEETESLVYLVLPHNPYLGIPESEIKNALGVGLEDVAAWVLGQQSEYFADDTRKNISIITKSWRNQGFKNMLKKDPVAILEAEFGEKLGIGKDIQVLEETDKDVFLIIPYLSDSCLYENEVDNQFINKPIILGSFPTPGSTINVQTHCLSV